MHRFFAVLLMLLPLQTSADGAKHSAGVFDYYVLTLSWSPNWCAREGDARGSDQCDARHDHGWIMHGLWPQFERGYPQFCKTAERAPSRRMTREMADVMGTSGLAWHQWNKHGTCTGLDAQGYYSQARAAYAAVTQPEILRQITEPLRLPAKVIEDSFLEANAGLASDQITVTCRDGYIHEVRLCLTKDLEPRRCGSDVLRDCSAPSALFTPIR